MVINALMLVLAVYFIQEGVAQQDTETVFFVEFPQKLLPLAYAAAAIIIPNFAINALVLRRNLRPRRWPWVTTAISLVCLVILVAVLGIDDTLTIIDPNW